jgi:hypothetical protein
METRIRARLTHINANLRNPEENGGARLQEVFDEVECVDPNSEDRLSAALFVLLAETAVRVNNSTIATECLRLYYSVHPPKDQFQIRALCCRAQLEAKLAAGLKGEVCSYLFHLSALVISHLLYFIIDANSLW